MKRTSGPLRLLGLWLALLLAAPAALGHGHDPRGGEDAAPPTFQLPDGTRTTGAAAGLEPGSCAFCRVGARLYAQPAGPSFQGRAADDTRRDGPAAPHLLPEALPGLRPARAPPTPPVSI